MCAGMCVCMNCIRLIQHSKFSLIWVQDLNIRPGIIKLLQEIKGEISLPLILAVIFFLLQHQKHSVGSHLFVESSKVKHTGAENRMMIARVGCEW